MLLISLLLQCMAYGLCVIEALEYDQTSPLCGNDGRTYDTTVDLHHAQLTNPKLRAAHAGRCHGKSYEDLSFFFRSQDNIIFHKTLDDYDLCSLDYAPVCGTDGKTYPNKCYFNSIRAKNPKLRIQHRGECKANLRPMEEESCPLFLDPVCGTDGKTYPNKCLLFKERKRNEHRLTIKHEGACKNSINDYDEMTCALNYDPVCGSDGKTYGNLCRLDANKIYHPTLHIKNDGPCREEYDEFDYEREEFSKELEKCTSIGTPVCGTDGKTYSDMCFLRVNRLYNTGLRIRHFGRCKEDYDGWPENVFRENKKGWCTLIWLPVCSTNDQTYGNKCFFNEDKKNNPSLSIKHYGPCEDESITAKKTAIRWRKLKPNRSVTQIDIKNGGKKVNNININLG